MVDLRVCVLIALCVGNADRSRTRALAWSSARHNMLTDECSLCSLLLSSSSIHHHGRPRFQFGAEDTPQRLVMALVLSLGF